MSTKTTQGKLWSVAPLYWAQFFEPMFLPMYREVLSELSLNEDDNLLDAGCGSGLFSHLAIKTGAEVIGVDAAPGLLDIARRRNPQNNFLEEDLESLPFKDDSFDVVAGFNSFQYAGNFETALPEAKRVLKTGGRIVVGIWANPALSDAVHVLKAIGLLLPPPPPGTPGPFALSEDGRMEALLRSAGLKLLTKKQVACPAFYESASDGVKAYMSTGPAAAALNINSRLVVEKTIREALQPFRIADDFHFMQNNFLFFIAEKE